MKHLSKQFRKDLITVCQADASDEFPIGELKALGRVLTKWRKDCLRELADLHPEHPARSPVSLFGVMEMGRLEVAHTRTLAWMLDPNCQHGFGDALLRALLPHVCGP